MGFGKLFQKKDGQRKTVVAAATAATFALSGCAASTAVDQEEKKRNKYRRYSKSWCASFIEWNNGA
ncbi:hypothetical protein GCM10020331_064730 [Ectobacillus funiculus]